MSNAITYDALVVHYLAGELDARLRGRRIRAVRFDSGNRRLVLDLGAERLAWELHPARGDVRLLGGTLPGDAAEGWSGRDVPIQRRARVRGVSAPLDERWLAVDLDPGGADRAARLVIELMTNQWNALALAPDGTIVRALQPRTAGERVLRAGRTYVPPAAHGTAREGAEEPVPPERWDALLADVEPGARRRVLVGALAWTSPLNATPILGDAARDPSAGALRAARERYVALATRPPSRPRILALARPQPYPLPLPDVDARPAVSLLAAFDAARDARPAGLAPEVRAALEERLRRLRARSDRLARESRSAPEESRRLRRMADLLMAQLHRVPRGAEAVDLDDFEGGSQRLELDPRLSAPENAEALYARARKRDRAARRLPERVRALRAERDRLESLLESLDAGDVDAEEVERWIAAVRPGEGEAGDAGERLPYVRYRSSGGLEIRVGRSGRANDRLTFGHAGPEDVWLHARDVAGAHVVLRWDRRDENPPARDLAEAAVLAALHSRARTSTTVPVDWTRRKHVRKPRKAPPGAVVPERVRTVFVEPDPNLPDRLRDQRK